jgi:hypothetical protein
VVQILRHFYCSYGNHFSPSRKILALNISPEFTQEKPKTSVSMAPKDGDENQGLGEKDFMCHP